MSPTEVHMMSSYPIHSNSLKAESEFNSDMAADGGDSSRSDVTQSVVCSGLDSADNTKTQQQLEASLSDQSDDTEFRVNSQRVSIDDLPDEILVRIFSHMSFSELVDGVQHVCTRWRRLAHDADLWSDKEYWITCGGPADFGSIKTCRTDEEAVQTFLACHSLRRVLLLRGAKARVLRALSTSCRRLTQLRLHPTQKLSHQVLKNLVERCSRIDTLRISNELLKLRKCAEAVSQMRHLRVLEFEEHSSQNLPVLSPLGHGCPQLTVVHFGTMTVDMDDLRQFLNAKRNTLKSICIKWTMADRRCVLPLLTVCAGSLESLALLKYDVLEEEAEEVFTALGSLPSLRQLMMAITSPLPPGAAVLAFQSGGLSELRVLQLQYGFGLDDAAVVAVSLGCPALRYLNLRRAERLTDAAFSQVFRLRQLETLDVSGCPGLGGAFLPRLTSLPRLQTLWMEKLDCARLQPGLSAITQLASLQCLGLNHSILTGVPFHEFPDKLVNLRELHVCWWRVSEETLHLLSTRMPSLAIHFAIQEDETTDDPVVDNEDAEYETDVSGGGEDDSSGALDDFSEGEEDSVG